MDGLSLLFGFEAYVRYHKVLAHNLLFGVAVVLASARWVGVRAGSLALVSLAYLSHLVGDYFASGPGWTMWPYLPFSARGYVCDCPFALFWWVNFVATLGGVLVLFGVAARDGRTPLEFVHAGLERGLVSRLRLASCQWCPSGAAFRCGGCGRPVCRGHIAAWKRLRPLCARCLAASEGG